MKFENFLQAQTIVERIEKHQRLLNDLSSGDIHVSIGSSSNIHNRIMVVGAYENHFEHDYSGLAGLFIDDIKADLVKRIDGLKADLEIL